jgi:hypothetical protein
LARLTPKETIAPASTMADTHIKKTSKGEQSRGEDEIGMTCTLQAPKTLTQISSNGSRAVEGGHVD